MKTTKTLQIDIPKEDLLASLEGEEREEILEDVDDVVPFLSHFNIRPGEYPVNKTLLYELYKQWSKNPVTGRRFSVKVGYYIPFKEFHRKWCFIINVTAFTLNRKTFDLFNEKPDKRKSPLYRQHFENFIRKYNLDKEEVWVPGYVLFHMYDKWTYRIKKHHPIGRHNFVQFCNIYFKKKRHKDSKAFCYLTTIDVFKHVPLEHIEQLEEGIKYSGKKRKRPLPRTKPPPKPEE